MLTTDKVKKHREAGLDFDYLDWLQSDGWSMEAEVVEHGGIDEMTRFRVTISRQGRSYTTEYSYGSVYRVWKKSARFILQGSPMQALAKPGKRVFIGPINARPCRKEFLQATTAPLPKLPDVIAALVLDAQTADSHPSLSDFCNSFGYDEDSREALRVFNACRTAYFEMKALAYSLDALYELFADY